MSQYKLNIPGEVIEGMADNYSGAGLYKVTYHVRSDKSASFHTAFKQDNEGRFVKTRIMPAWNRGEAQKQNKLTVTYVHDENDLIQFLKGFEPKFLTSFLPAGNFTVDAKDEEGAVRRYVRNSLEGNFTDETLDQLNQERFRKDRFHDVHVFRNRMVTDIADYLAENLPEGSIIRMGQMDLFE